MCLDNAKALVLPVVFPLKSIKLKFSIYTKNENMSAPVWVLFVDAWQNFNYIIMESSLLYPSYGFSVHNKMLHALLFVTFFLFGLKICTCLLCFISYFLMQAISCARCSNAR